jgi:transposase
VGVPATCGRLQQIAAAIMPQLEVEIVKRSDQAKGFEVRPKRWITERTFAWLGRCRRLAKDFENPMRNAAALVCPASVQLMLKAQSIINFPDRL